MKAFLISTWMEGKFQKRIFYLSMSVSFNKKILEAYKYKIVKLHTELDILDK